MSYRTFILGRHEDCDIGIDDSSVSREHAEVISSSGQMLVHDKASTFGSFVEFDGQWDRIEQLVIKPGMRLRFGDFETTAEDLSEAVDELLNTQPVRHVTNETKPEPQVRIVGVIRRNPETGEIERG